VSPTAFRRRAAVLGCACALAAVAAPAAHAQPVHQVVAGETLSQIAAVNGLSPAALAAANGVAVDAPIRVGQVVSIPARAGASAPPVTDVVATSGTAVSSTSPAGGTTGAPTSAGTSSTASGSSSAGGGSSSGGGVVVRPGDTLSAIAARAGVSVSRLAAYNGVTASALLPAGRHLSLPAPDGGSGAPGSSASAATTTSGGGPTAAGGSGSATSASAASSSAASPPPGQVPAPGATGVAPSSGVRVSGSQVGSTAAANGVPTALARAIAWQESGNNNGAVSSVGARGVMQVMPDTWTWIDRNLSSRTLDPSSAADNVQAGTLYLQHLLRETGGDQDQAAAAYYQGLSSVRRRGMYDDTKRYVQSVRALRARFGG
jgi:N-acetylmuramoyl-L-alanine amidase